MMGGKRAKCQLVDARERGSVGAQGSGRPHRRERESDLRG